MRNLNLQSTILDDSHIVRIVNLFPQLQSLEADCGNLTPGALRSLQSLTHLKRVALERCNLTKEHVALLATFSQLEQLSLYGNAIDDQALAPLAALTHLRQLDLDGTSASPATFKGIRGSWRPRPGF